MSGKESALDGLAKAALGESRTEEYATGWEHGQHKLAALLARYEHRIMRAEAEADDYRRRFKAAWGMVEAAESLQCRMSRLEEAAKLILKHLANRQNIAGAEADAGFIEKTLKDALEKEGWRQHRKSWHERASR